MTITTLSSRELNQDVTRAKKPLVMALFLLRIVADLPMSF